MRNYKMRAIIYSTALKLGLSERCVLTEVLTLLLCSHSFLTKEYIVGSTAITAF